MVYYNFQKHKEFSDILTATFQPNSIGAETIIKNGLCKLIFDSYSQKFELQCKVKKLESSNPFYQSTWWHNILFNPSLHPETVILSFSPNWDLSF